jgi:cytochrome P450
MNYSVSHLEAHCEQVEEPMATVSESATVYWDPYHPGISANPYAIYRRLRDEAPLYYNKEHDFYAVSRFSDVDSCLLDHRTFSSARSDILEFIKANTEVPKGMFIWEDPPLHTAYRNVVARVFTPKRMNALEEQIRAYCARCLDPLVGAERIDFIADLGAKLPGGVIGMLFGIPDEARDEIRERIDGALRTEAGKPMDVNQAAYKGTGFEEYLDWRSQNPSTDLMTELLNVVFQDETGAKRKLTRDEILIFINVLAGAGNETTSRLIGWIGKVLSDHPDQRRELAGNPSLIPAAIEEILRVEPPGTQVARYVTRDFEIHGRTVPEGSVMQCLVAAANRDERRFPDADRFDIHREGAPAITFGRGIHSCIGSALARVEGRVALDEVLKRFPDWTVDLENSRLSSSSTTRGWDTLPAYMQPTRGVATGSRQAAAVSASGQSAPVASPPASLGGETWQCTLQTPAGPQEMTVQLVRDGDVVTGRIDSPMGGEAISNGKVVGDKLTWTMQVSKPMSIKLSFDIKVEGAQMTGKVKLGIFGSAALTGHRV